MFRRAPFRGGRGRWAASDFFMYFWVQQCLFFEFFSSNAHGLLQVLGRLAFTSLLPTCSAISVNAAQPRTLQVSLVWAREAMTMTTYTNAVLYVLYLWFIQMRCGSHAFLGPRHNNPYLQKSEPFMRLPSEIFVSMTSPRHQV